MKGISQFCESQGVSMTFSYSLIEKYKVKTGITSDNKASKEIAGLTSGVVSELKSGKRQLTDEQALVIAKVCDLDMEWVLVNLSEERSKNPEIKSAWSNLAKKLAANGLALVLVGFLSINSGYQVGKHVLLRRSRLFA